MTDESTFELVQKIFKITDEQSQAEKDSSDVTNKVDAAVSIAISNKGYDLRAIFKGMRELKKSRKVNCVT